MSVAPLYALLALWTVSRYVGRPGRDRFLGLGDDRAVAVHGQLTSSWSRGAIVALVVVNPVLAVLSADEGSWGSVVAGVVGCVASLLALGLLPRARREVEAGFAERGLAAREGRETSEQRTRRTRQLGAVVVGSFVVAVLASVLAERVDSVWVYVVVATGWITTLLGLLALAWASVWVYGDEQPASR